MHAEVEQRSKCMIVRVTGDLRLWNRVSVETELLKEIRSQLDRCKVQVLLNLAGLTHIDTRGIAALAVIPIDCMKRRLHISIVLSTNAAGQAVRRTRMLSPCPMYDDEAAALSAIEAPGAST